MAEEFQESEVIFQENVVNGGADVVECRISRKENPKRKKKKTSSIPVDIPEAYSGNPWVRCVELDFFEDNKDDELVPPHVIVGQRIFAGKMAFSVCSGNGRTLKGRDLSQVRNSILRMTGFLET